MSSLDSEHSESIAFSTKPADDEFSSCLTNKVFNEETDIKPEKPPMPFPSTSLKQRSQPSEVTDNSNQTFFLLEDENFLEKWFMEEGTVSVESIWRHCLVSETNSKSAEVNYFLPIEDEVKEWLQQLATKTAGISVTLQEFLFKGSSKISLERILSEKSASKQHFATLLRFYSFCLKGRSILRESFELDQKFLGLVLDPKYALGFLLQVVKHGRHVITVKRYQDSLLRMVEYLVQGDLIKADAVHKFNKISAHLDLFMSARKVKDSSNQLLKSIAKTESIERFDYEELRKVVTVANFISVIDALKQVKSLRSNKNKRKLNIATGAVAISLILPNVCHWVDISWMTLKDFQKGLDSADEKFIIFQPSKTFKGSFTKTKTMFKLAIPSRYIG